MLWLMGPQHILVRLGYVLFPEVLVQIKAINYYYRTMYIGDLTRHIEAYECTCTLLCTTDDGTLLVWNDVQKVQEHMSFC